MKNEIEKRQREDDNNAKANQSTQELMDTATATVTEQSAQNGSDSTEDTTESTEPTLTNGVSNAPTKLVAC